MATINAYESIDLDDLNFNRPNGGYPEVEYYDNEPLDMAGVTYNHTFSVYYNYDDDSADFAGSNIVADLWTGTMVGGTVNGIAEGYYNYAEGYYWYSYAIHGVSDSATAIENAISTPWTTDDQAVVESMFSGADFFDLSAADDTARGYGGNDKMFGYDGNDWLWGGLGNDKKVRTTRTCSPERRAKIP